MFGVVDTFGHKTYKFIWKGILIVRKHKKGSLKTMYLLKI